MPAEHSIFPREPVFQSARSLLEIACPRKGPLQRHAVNFAVDKLGHCVFMCSARIIEINQANRHVASAFGQQRHAHKHIGQEVCPCWPQRALRSCVCHGRPQGSIQSRCARSLVGHDGLLQCFGICNQIHRVEALHIQACFGPSTSRLVLATKRL